MQSVGLHSPNPLHVTIWLIVLPHPPGAGCQSATERACDGVGFVRIRDLGS